MRIRALDAGGDWVFGQGSQSYRGGEAAIDQDIGTALRVFKGECFFATDFGVDWWNLLGGKDRQAIVLACREVIADRPGVVRINKVDSALDADTRRLGVTYNVSTIYSLQTTNTVEAPSVSAA